MADATGKLEAPALLKWTTAALVVYIAKYAATSRPPDIMKKNAQLCAAELNARIPPRELP